MIQIANILPFFFSSFFGGDLLFFRACSLFQILFSSPATPKLLVCVCAVGWWQLKSGVTGVPTRPDPRGGACRVDVPFARAWLRDVVVVVLHTHANPGLIHRHQ